MEKPIFSFNYDRKKYKPKLYCECGGHIIVQIDIEDLEPFGRCSTCGKLNDILEPKSKTT